MSTAVGTSQRLDALYGGLRMTAQEFLQIRDESRSYELVDGVVIVSPSPSPRHQALTVEILTQIALYLRDHPVGMVFPETDVHLGRGPTGGDLVYRPELVFVGKERLAQMEETISGPPELIVEVVSRGSRRYDTETKKADYQRHGVTEYWIIDPQREEMTFCRLQQGQYQEVHLTGNGFASEAVPGFALDVARVRKMFKPW